MFGVSLQLEAWCLALLFKVLSSEKGRLACQLHDQLSVRPNLPQQICLVRRTGQAERKSLKLSRAGTAKAILLEYDKLP
jgi:hypothetical protein